MTKSWNFKNATLFLHDEPAAALAWNECVAPEEIARAQGMQSPERAHTFLCSRALLRQQLAARLGIPAPHIAIALSAEGKPHLSGSPISFSLSHSHGQILIGLTDTGTSIGVDLQRPDANVDICAIARRLFNESDNKALETMEGAARRQRAWELWCLREAQFKMDGRRQPANAPKNSWTVGTLDNGYIYAVSVA
ncbi:MAG: 4'-phosphopantetheinyl transferase superfamily protein [Bdellovibrionales bacterium]